MKHNYDIIDHFDIWKEIDGGWTVNDSMIVAHEIELDLQAMSSREIFRIFCAHTGYNNRLRAVELDGDFDYYLDITYTGKALGGHYPIGAIVRSYSDIENKREESNV